MPKGSLEQTNARKEEIINACEALCKTMSFKDITMKEISVIGVPGENGSNEWLEPVNDTQYINLK